jgi:hypothetical protein
VKTVGERVEDAMREVGTLVMAFAPLDAAFADGDARVSRLLLFGAYGLLLFVGSLWLERRRG